MKRYDLIVIGAGPGGEKAAVEAAYFGHKVALVERQPVVGGAMINTGTLPSKTLRETSLFIDEFKHRNLYGIKLSMEENITVKKFMYREKEVIRTEHKLVMDNLIYHNIDLIQAHGYIEDAHTVRLEKLDGQTDRIMADFICIATGSHPLRPEGINFDSEHIYDSDSILKLDKLPKSLGILGAGVIGCEYASIFSLLGIEIHLVDRRPTLLPFIDGEIIARLQKHMKETGVNFHLGTEYTGLEVSGSGKVTIQLVGGDTLAVDKVLFAGGRVGTSQKLGLEALGIEADQRCHIKVNGCYQTSVPNIYAIGDVIGFPALASTAMEQGRIAVCHAFNHTYKKQLTSIIPYGIYTVPEISMVGLTEEEAKKHGIDYEVGRFDYVHNARGLIIGDTSGLIKLIFAASEQTLPGSVNIPGLKKQPDGTKHLVTQQLLGVHIIGELATELVHIGMGCLYYHGTIDYFIQSVFNFPTLAEAFKYAAYDGLSKRKK
ncbi:MAG: hypothetical protein A2Y62_08960 [Candidatus Fischerbacteria bacterium RBG_13_37_8]|uniref:NAD(P)(+) transhydrogenase (Si-specific) n=1 Tax=Candidatus Fischerbacteria bacterium RBG_13_37_8 TaxID=1817863 RepID=A0A1F5VV54_9BACT|nr:MAG: hypothetical protein A2Y62_08960 [Candidatus Fischerbacteria bacterium RBG_13_37_8]